MELKPYTASMLYHSGSSWTFASTSPLSKPIMAENLDDALAQAHFWYSKNKAVSFECGNEDRIVVTGPSGQTKELPY